MPTIKQLSRIQSDDTNLNRLQDQLSSALNPILKDVKGDLSGPLESPIVKGLQGRLVSPAAPESGATLVFDGRQWVPVPVGLGVFVSRVDQNIPAFAANTPLAAAAEVTELSRGITVESNGATLSRFTVQSEGTYEASFSVQLQLASGNKTTIYQWLRKNGTDVPDSTSNIEMGSNHQTNFPYNSFIVEMSAGDYIEFMFAADTIAGTPTLETLPAVVGPPSRPLDPSIIVNMRRIATY